MGVSVTERANQMKSNGYIRLGMFAKTVYSDNRELNPDEPTKHGILVGTTIDYLNRLNFFWENNAEDHVQALTRSFIISIKGAQAARKDKDYGEAAWYRACGLLLSISGLDVRSIESAYKLVSYDVWSRNSSAAKRGPIPGTAKPDPSEVENIQIMLDRCKKFWEDNGPVSMAGFVFAPNGYTRAVSSGDGDFLSNDTLWDFKVVRGKITSKDCLQLLMYWVMGQHSGNERFNGIKNIGFYNPRKNEVYKLAIDSIPEETIREVEHDAICYGRKFDDWGRLLPDDILI